jgi:hypothetical protein
VGVIPEGGGIKTRHRGSSGEGEDMHPPDLTRSREILLTFLGAPRRSKWVFEIIDMNTILVIGRHVKVSRTWEGSLENSIPSGSMDH